MKCWPFGVLVEQPATQSCNVDPFAPLTRASHPSRVPELSPPSPDYMARCRHKLRKYALPSCHLQLVGCANNNGKVSLAKALACAIPASTSASSISSTASPVGHSRWSLLSAVIASASDGSPGIAAGARKSTATPYRPSPPSSEAVSAGSAPTPPASVPMLPSASSTLGAEPRNEAAIMMALLGPVDCGFSDVTLEQWPELAVPRLVFRARANPIEDAGIRTMLGTLDDVFARAQPITIMYDLRGASIPSKKQIKIALDWICQNSHLLDRHLQGIAIILSSFLVRGVVNVVLSLTKPPQPNAVCAKEEQAYDFARDQCTEIKEWVSAKKLKRQQSASAQALSSG